MLPSVQRHRIFSSMLSGAAMNYYLTNIKGKCNNIFEMESSIRKRFVTDEGSLALTRELDSTNLVSYTAKYPDKSQIENLNLMIRRL